MAVDPMDRDPNLYTRETEVVEPAPRSSNTLAYLIGGLVIALGILAFLFYDGGSRDVTTTGSTTVPPAAETAPVVPAAPAPPKAAAPAAPAAPAPAAPAPAAPATPAPQ